MADLPALRSALERLGFSGDARTNITEADHQGISSLNIIKRMTDDDVETLMRTVRKPGGTIAQADGTRIANPGIAVSAFAEKNFKLMVYFLRHKERTSRTLQAADITLDNVNAIRELREVEHQHEDPTNPEFDTRDWPKVFDGINEWLDDCHGVTGVPLSYVIRPDEAVPTEADDPSTGYETVQLEMIARAPIKVADAYVATYKSDRVRVWNKLSAVFRDKDCYTYMRTYQRSKDGRKAFIALKDHYLGSNNVANMASAAEAKLRTSTYKNEGRRFNFEKCARLHKEQHTILEGLTMCDYAGIDDGSKVRYLMGGIQNSQLETVKTQILASPNLLRDFDACVDLYKNYIQQAGSAMQARDAKIAGLGQEDPKKRKRDPKDVKPDMSVELRYYKKHEYGKLTNAQKAALKIKRDERDGKKQKQNKGLDERTIKALNQLAEQFQSLTTGNPQDQQPPADGGAPAGGDATQNRNNPALNRRGAGV